MYNLAKGTWATGVWDDEKKSYVSDVGHETKLPDGLRFRAVWTSLDGLVSEGEARTRFRPQGDATHTYVHLEDQDGQEYTIEVQALLGRAEVKTGWLGPR